MDVDKVFWSLYSMPNAVHQKTSHQSTKRDFVQGILNLSLLFVIEFSGWIRHITTLGCFIENSRVVAVHQNIFLRVAIFLKNSIVCFQFKFEEIAQLFQTIRLFIKVKIFSHYWWIIQISTLSKNCQIKRYITSYTYYLDFSCLEF